MEFYTEQGKDLYISLKGLINKNGGNFKSPKQAWFLSQYAEGYVGEFVERGYIDELEEGQGTIHIQFHLHFGHGYGKGNVPGSWFFVLDQHGVVKLYRFRYQRNRLEDGSWSGGWDLKGAELKWERTEITYFPPKKEEKPKPVSHSEWVGTVGDRQEFTLTVVKEIPVESQWGAKSIYILEDEAKNVIKYVSSNPYWNEGETYKMGARIKSHDEYRDTKQTVITRPTKIEEVPR